MDIYSKFNALVSDNNHKGVISLLKNFRKINNPSDDEIGWVYWNISDNYALLRDYDNEFKNHIEFVEWGKKHLYPEKLHWFVSDGTQALTLSLGNYFEYWIEWYLYACKNSDRTIHNRAVRFESHRATIASLIKLKEMSVLDEALSNLNAVLLEDDRWENLFFSKLTYFSLLLERHFLLKDEKKMNKLCMDIHDLINDNLISYFEDYDEPEILGSWSQLNQSRKSKKYINTLLHNLGCIFYRIGKYNESVKMFEKALNNEHRINRYGMALYCLSLWNEKKDRQNVIGRFNSVINEYEPSALYKFNPVLKEIFES